MACKSCLNKISGVCKVCQAVDGDETVKAVVFCKFCGVYICDKCNGDLTKRMKAFIKVRL